MRSCLLIVTLHSVVILCDMLQSLSCFSGGVVGRTGGSDSSSHLGCVLCAQCVSISHGDVTGARCDAVQRSGNRETSPRSLGQ